MHRLAYKIASTTIRFLFFLIENVTDWSEIVAYWSHQVTFDVGIGFFLRVAFNGQCNFFVAQKEYYDWLKPHRTKICIESNIQINEIPIPCICFLIVWHLSNNKKKQIKMAKYKFNSLHLSFDQIGYSSVCDMNTA